jgi:hypothetical protein
MWDCIHCRGSEERLGWNEHVIRGVDQREWNEEIKKFGV